MSTGGDRYDIHVVELFRTDTRRDIIQAVIAKTVEREAFEYEDRQKFRKAELIEWTGRSGEAIRQELIYEEDGPKAPLFSLGVLEVLDPDAHIRHFKLADTEVAEMLLLWPEGVVALCELFEKPARRNLVAWFLDQSDPEQSYSQNEIHEASGVGQQAISDHIEILVESDVVEGVEGEEDIAGVRHTEYTLAPTEMVQYLNSLNELLIEEFQ